MATAVLHAMIDALRADGPAADRAAGMALYGWLVGSWEVDLFDGSRDGVRQRSRGEWHFGWVLEGRAIQDVFIVPGRALRAADTPAAGNRYGTTLRVYDPRFDVWHVTWINPVTGAHDTMIGRKDGDAIVQHGHSAEGRPIRWSFVDISPDSFRWTGETSQDGGASWQLVVEFLARRVA